MWAHSLLERAGDNLCHRARTAWDGQSRGKLRRSAWEGFRQGLEFPTWFIPIIHQIWFQMPLGDSQASNRPQEGDWSPPQICTRNPMCAESSCLQRASQKLSSEPMFLSPKVTTLRRNTLIWIFKFWCARTLIHAPLPLALLVRAVSVSFRVCVRSASFSTRCRRRGSGSLPSTL